MYPADGTSGLAITLNDLYCLEPTSVIEFHQEHNWPTNHFEGKANTFVLPRGRECGRGAVLMLWSDVSSLVSGNNGSPIAFTHTLRFRDSYGDVQIKKLGIVRVKHLTGVGGKLVADAACLVELADIRYLGKYTPIDKAYNYRSYRGLEPVSNTQMFYDSTTNGGTAWSWSQVLTELWNLLPSQFGSLTNNGDYPTSPPENLIFRGIPCWDAINSILQVTNNYLVRDLNGNFTIVSAQDPQAVGMENATHRDAIWIPTNDRGFGGLFPEKIRVYFPTDKGDFQNDADSESIAGQDAYLLNPLYTKDITTTAVLPGVSVVPNTKAIIHAPKALFYAVQGGTLNSGACDTMATQLATSWAYAHNFDSFSLHTIYHGAHQGLLPGSETEAVAWYSTGEGSKTEVLMSPLRYAPEDSIGTLGQHFAQEIFSSEFRDPPDLARKHEPTERFAVATLLSDIGCVDGRGTATIQYATPSGSNVTWSGSGKTVTVHNPAQVTYKTGDRVNILFHWQSRRWIIVGPAIAPLYRAVLAADMCAGAPATFDQYPYNLNCCSDTYPTLTAANPFALEGLSGDPVLLAYDCASNGLIVVQVKHHSIDVVLYPFTTTDGCEPELDEQGQPTGNTVPTGQCKITYRRKTITAMTCDSNVINYTLLSMTSVDVLTDIFVDGLIIMGTFVPIFVLCQCTPYDDPLIIGTNCDYGSGSSQGSQPGGGQ